MSIAANKVPGIRAALCFTADSARLAREHNDANVLALAGDTTDPSTAWAIVERWLATPFEGGRHTPRGPRIDALTRVESGALRAADPIVADLLRREARRQATDLQLIASENFVSEAVLEATASVLTNKYAEGYPGKRYYGGCEFVDIAEDLARDRAKELFNADFANVQPHSGSQANAAVYLALLQAGDTILGMSLADGGHLTHGSKVNFSGKLFNAVQYGLDPATGIDSLDMLAAIRRLEPDDRALLAMRYVAGFNATELSAATGLTPSGTRNRLERLLTSLRQELSHE